MTRPDIAIVGGGIIGAACAWTFARRGVSVTLLDSGAEAGIATPAAAGMLAPLAETRQDDPLLSLSVLARDLYADIVPDLEATTGIKVGLHTDGILQVAFNDDEATHLKNDIAWQRQQGFMLDWVSIDELREDYPGLSDEIVGGKLASEDGALEPESLLRAFVEGAEAHGAVIRRGVAVDGVVMTEGRITGVRTGPETVAAGNVVVAAGAWSGRLAGLPRPLSVEPIRGQMAAVDWPPDVPPSIVYGGGGYVLHRNGEALVGSTMEHAGYDPSTTPAGVERVIATAIRIYPALEHAPVKREWAGLRPVTPDGAPMIGPDPDVPGLWYATGHGRNGILLAGLTAQILVQQLCDEPIERDIRPVNPGRFWRL